MHVIEDMRAEDLPRVTILIATHNYKEFLQDAFTSAVNQTYQNKQVVIVDDCSTDGTSLLIEDIFNTGGVETSFKDYDDYKVTLADYHGCQVMYVQLKNNVGPSEARNIGIELSKDATDIYAILDADDIMHLQKVTRCVIPFLMSTSVGVVYADYDNVNTETGVTVREYKEPFSRDRLLQECIVHSGSLISKTALEQVKDEFGYYDREMRTCEDYDLWIRISAKFVIIHVAEPLTIVRVQPKNSTLTVDREIWERNWRRIAMKLQGKHEQRIE